MTRHSKNNSSLHHFTHAERTRLDYGTKKQRLGKDSLRSFYDCYLCLQRARDPMCCAKGHVSCRECVLESILAQTKEVDRQKKALAAQQDRLAKEDAERAELEQQRQVEQFARAQSLLSRESNSGASSKKRKLDDPEEKETKTLKVAGAVAGSGDKPALPSFWLVGLSFHVDCPVPGF